MERPRDFLRQAICTIVFQRPPTSLELDDLHRRINSSNGRVLSIGLGDSGGPDRIVFCMPMGHIKRLERSVALGLLLRGCTRSIEVSQLSSASDAFPAAPRRMWARITTCIHNDLDLTPLLRWLAINEIDICRIAGISVGGEQTTVIIVEGDASILDQAVNEHRLGRFFPEAVVHASLSSSRPRFDEDTPDGIVRVFGTGSRPGIFNNIRNAIYEAKQPVAIVSHDAHQLPEIIEGSGDWAAVIGLRITGSNFTEILTRVAAELHAMGYQNGLSVRVERATFTVIDPDADDFAPVN